MGLISSITKVFNYTRRALKLTPEFIFSDGADIIGKGYRAANGSIFSKAKAGVKAFESHVGKLSTQGGFLSRLCKNVASIPTSISRYAKAGIRLAGMKNTSKVLGCLKGVGKGIAKKMPIIGTILTIAFEMPSIIEGYKKEGIIGALKQAGGAGIELGCMAVGSAIGSCFGPGIGTLVGGIVGGVVGMFVRNAIVPEVSSEEESEGEQPSDDTTNPTIPTTPDNPSDSSDPQTPTNPTTPTVPTDPTIPVNPPNPSIPTIPGLPTDPAIPSNPFGQNPFNPGFGMTNPFGTGMGFGTGFGMTNPFGTGMGFGTGFGMTNPFGTGMGFGTGFGMTILQPGENIFLKYPFGYQFQYVGL